MEFTLQISSSRLTISPSPQSSPHRRRSCFGVNGCPPRPFIKISATGSSSPSGLQFSSSNAAGVSHRRISTPESLFCYDKAVPEEIIEKPIGLSLSEKTIGKNSRCTDCQAKGAVLCSTCSGSGLYVDSIMESQGIIVKVRCLALSWGTVPGCLEDK